VSKKAIGSSYDQITPEQIQVAVAKVRHPLLPHAMVRRPLGSTILKGDRQTTLGMMPVTCRKKGPSREYRPCMPMRMIKDRI
jgi:hypothetical protein